MPLIYSDVSYIKPELLIFEVLRLPDSPGLHFDVGAALRKHQNDYRSPRTQRYHRESFCLTCGWNACEYDLIDWIDTLYKCWVSLYTRLAYIRCLNSIFVYSICIAALEHMDYGYMIYCIQILYVGVMMLSSNCLGWVDTAYWVANDMRADGRRSESRTTCKKGTVPPKTIICSWAWDAKRRGGDTYLLIYQLYVCTYLSRYVDKVCW